MDHVHLYGDQNNVARALNSFCSNFHNLNAESFYDLHLCRSNSIPHIYYNVVTYLYFLRKNASTETSISFNFITAEKYIFHS